MKGNAKHKMIGKSKPSQASLVSRGLAANPALLRFKEAEHEGPPSIRSGYSLYSSDSESTTVEVNRGLNRCAKLLSNMLDTSEDQPHSAKTGHAVYRHQGQRSKTISTKSHKNHSHKHQEPKASKSLQKNPPTERKMTKASHAKVRHTKKTVDVAPTAATSTSQAKVRSTGQRSPPMHIIPTGTGNEPAAKSVSASKPNPTPRISKQRTAPGFQDHVTSSTPIDRESPERSQHAVVMLNEPTKLSEHQNHGQKCQLLTSVQELSADLEIGHHRSLLEAANSEFRPDNSIDVKQNPEKEHDWMKWYEESVAKQATSEGQASVDPNSSLFRRYQDQLSEPEGKIFNLPLQEDAILNQGRSRNHQQVHQPLQESQDLLQDLVRQLTILNQTSEKSVPRGYTQDVLQGLIDRNRHKQATIPPNPKVAWDRIQGPSNPPSESQSSVNRDQPTRSEPSLDQMLSDFCQVSPQKPPTLKPEGQLEMHPYHPLTSRTHLDQNYLNTADFQPTKDNLSAPTTNVLVQKSAAVTPNKHNFEDGRIPSHLSTPSVSQTYPRDPIAETGKHVQVGDDHSSPAFISSPPRSLGPLVLDPTTIKQRSMQQVRTLQYLLRELQAVLANLDDTEVSRLLNELEEVCNTLPYTTQKQLLDLNTEILLAVQPLQSENSQLRRRLRIANHQLKSRELAEKEKKDDSTISMEVLTLQALNCNLQKQLREERHGKEQLMKNNLETSKRLEEKEQQHQNMLRILEEKDSNLLKSRQDCLGELQDLRDARSELQSKVDYLQLQVEGANKQTRILQLSLDQRDNEIARLKSFNQSLQEQITSITSRREDRVASPPTVGGMSLQRMNRLLMERNPLAANKENIQTPLHSTSSRTTHSRLYASKNLSEMEERSTRSSGYDERLQKSPKKSPKQKVAFAEVDSWNPRDKAIYDWARSDTLWKDQQAQQKDLISFDMEEDRKVINNTDLAKSARERSSSLQEKQVDDAEPRLIDQLLLTDKSSPEQKIPFKYSPILSHSIKDIDNSLDQNAISSSKFNPKLAFSHAISDFQSVPQSSEIDFSSGPRPPLNVMAEPRPYSSHDKTLNKPETGSVISDSTVSSITSQYEAQFQSGLRDLDAEIGKLQASLKYSGLKS